MAVIMLLRIGPTKPRRLTEILGTMTRLEQEKKEKRGLSREA